MSRSVSTAFKQAIFGQETDEVFIILLDVEHDDLVETIRVSSDGVDTVHNGNTYAAYPFQLTLPSDPEEGFCSAKLTIDNVHRDIIAAVRQISSAPTITMTIVLASDPNTVEAQFSNFRLLNVQYDVLTITGDLSLTPLTAEPYPCGSFLPSNFPGLF